MTTEEKMQKRAGLVVQMRTLTDAAIKENRDNTADELAKYAAIEKDFDAISAQIERENKLGKIEGELRNLRDPEYRADLNAEASNGRSRKVDSKPYKSAMFDHYARVGLNGLMPDVRNALQVGTSSEGGYIVPTEFETQIVSILTNLDPIRAGATVITTASDRNIPIETSKGTFAYIAEEGEFVASDTAFGQVVLSSFKSGGIVKVSEELLQDAFFNLEAYLAQVAGERFNTLEETNFANGDGTGKPKGIFATASVGGVNVTSTASASGTTITPDNLVDCYHALGRPYRMNATWLMADSTIKLIRKIKTGISGDLTYIWQPSLVVGQPDTILGRPVVATGGAPAATTGLVSVALVDLRKYYIADRLGTTMQRLNELYAANGQVGFKFQRRNDGRLVDAKALSIITQA
jgi:HK97 family phage major capsid protein